MLDGVAEDDRYVSPEFDLPSASDEDESPPAKRKRHSGKKDRPPKGSMDNIADEEELALALLRRH